MINWFGPTMFRCLASYRIFLREIDCVTSRQDRLRTPDSQDRTGCEFAAIDQTLPDLLSEHTERRRTSGLAFAYPDSATAWKRQHGPIWIVGTSDEAERTVRRFRPAGAERIIFQGFLPDDLDMIDLLGELAHAWAPGFAEGPTS